MRPKIDPGADDAALLAASVAVMENTTVIETNGLTKRYGNGVLAVDSVEMSVRRGELYGFLGPNGAGENDHPADARGPHPAHLGHGDRSGPRTGGPGRAREDRLPCGGARLLPIPAGRGEPQGGRGLRRDRPQACAEVLDIVELTSRAGRKFGTYSTGMKQRLGVAAALLKDPELLILDEPTNGLDPQGMAEMRKVIKDIGQGNRTVLLSSHLLAEVEQICDRVGVISRRKTSDPVDCSGAAGRGRRAGQGPAGRPRVRAFDRHVRSSPVSRQDGSIRLKTDPAGSVEINKPARGCWHRCQ